ncbi:energy transducer TonB [bacterium]|nr:energy transducer TonB [bacterium]
MIEVLHANGRGRAVPLYQPPGAMWTATVISAGFHAFLLFWFWPFSPVQIPMESAVGRMSLQLVATPVVLPRKKPVPKPRPEPLPAVVEEAVNPVEIPPAEPPVPEVPAMLVMEVEQIPPEPVQEPIREPATEPVQEKMTEDAPTAVSDPAPATGMQLSEAQEIHVSSAPAYLNNPKPEYPLAAQRSWYEGRVILRVAVSEKGEAMAVTVDVSSGYRILDLAAQRAVKQWKFIPARRGPVEITSECLVPIRFSLNKGVNVE